MRISDWSSDVCSSDLKLVELREVDAREVLALIDEHPGFVLKALELIVELLERPRGGEQVLPIIGRIEHADLCRGGGARRVDPDDDGADRAQPKRCGEQIIADGRSGYADIPFLLEVGSRGIGSSARWPH